jgi:hypothetical protein
MNTKPASAFGLAMLAVAFSFSTSFACPEAQQTTASVVESVLPESGMSVTPLAEASPPEGQAGEVAAPAPVVRTIGAPSTDASAPPAIAFADAIPVEVIETVTVVVPGQNAEEDEGAAITALGIAGFEPSVTEESSQTTAPESKAMATDRLSAQTGTAEAQIAVAEPVAVVVEIEPHSVDVNAPPAIAFANAISVEITETLTVVVPGQKSEEDERAALPASGIGIESSVTEESSQTAAPESEAKATPELSAQTGAAEAQIEVAEPVAVIAAVEPLSTDVNAFPAVVSVHAVRVEITETVTVVVPGQTSEHNDEVEITGTEPEHPFAAPNLKRDEATAARGE